MGWIDAVKLGTGSGGNSIVVYSRCPHSPYANGTAGNAGTDGCRLWWAPTSGGAAHQIDAAPADTSVGVAEHGVVFFAVQHNTAREHQPARVESARLTGTSAHALQVPTPDGATIDDISANGTQVAFSEAPRSPEDRMGVSEIWLDDGAAAAQLIAKVVADDVPIDNSAQYFDGLTLTSGFVYAFLYAQSGIYPPVPSQLEQISLPGLATAAAPWAPAGALSADGIGATAFDPSDNRLVLSLFSPQSEFRYLLGVLLDPCRQRQGLPGGGNRAGHVRLTVHGGGHRRRLGLARAGRAAVLAAALGTLALGAAASAQSAAADSITLSISPTPQTAFLPWRSPPAASRAT